MKTLYSKPKTKNNQKIMKDLDMILDEANKITMDNLDFDKTFREQGKILCDIRHLLSDKTNKSFKCDPVISSKLNDKNFNIMFHDFKKNHTFENNTKSITINKSHSKTVKKSKPTIKGISTYRKTTSGKHKSIKLNNNKYNTRYPIVIIKKKTPRKNVIYMQ